MYHPKTDYILSAPLDCVQSHATPTLPVLSSETCKSKYIIILHNIATNLQLITLGFNFSCLISGPFIGQRITFKLYNEIQNVIINLLTPKDPYSGRTAPLTSKLCILYIYSTNRGTEYFKHCIYSPFLFLQNAVCFIILTHLVPLLFTFYIEGVLKLKKHPAPKG